MKPEVEREAKRRAEKLTIPSVANLSILRSGYFVSPANRSSRCTGRRPGGSRPS